MTRSTTPIINGYRKCTKCHDTKPIDEFNKRKSRIGIVAMCKTCTAARARRNWAREKEHRKKPTRRAQRAEYWQVFYARAKDRITQANRNWRHRLRLEVFQHYSNSVVPRCACCGEVGMVFLTLDHVNGDGHRDRHRNGYRRAGVSLFAKVKAQGFPPEYQVLCFNCNCAKGTRLECPHQDMNRAANDIRGAKNA